MEKRKVMEWVIGSMLLCAVDGFNMLVKKSSILVSETDIIYKVYIIFFKVSACPHKLEKNCYTKCK